MNKYLKHVLDHGPHCKCKGQQQQQEQEGQGQGKTGKGQGEKGPESRESKSYQNLYKDYNEGFSQRYSEQESKPQNIKDLPQYGYQLNYNNGGNSWQEETMKEWMKNPITDKLAKLILAVLDKECGNGLYESPRFDSEKLVRGIVTKHLPLSKLRKEERERKRLVMLADISGSCSVVCNSLSAACFKVMEYDPRLVVVLHSNNEIWKIFGQDCDSREMEVLIQDLKKATMLEGYRHPVFMELWGQLFRYLSLKTCIAFGDRDADWVYASISELGLSQFFFMPHYKIGHGQAQQLRSTVFNKRAPNLIFDHITEPNEIYEALCQYVITGKGAIEI